jgi:hypothetical protein
LPKPNSRRRRGARHIGADPEFARTLARQEFGRIYWNDALEAELRKRLRFSQQRQVPAAVPKEPPRATAPARVPAKPETPRSPQWTPPRLREQRQKLAEARARLLEGRKTEHGGEEA